MGMVCNLWQITPEQLAEFRRTPRSAYEYVSAPFFENPQMVQVGEQMLSEIQRKIQTLPAGFRAQVQRVADQYQTKAEARKGPQLMKLKAAAEPERREFSLEKDWHVLHYALNGTAEGGTGALANAILGGEEIPDVDGESGYGPLRCLNPEQVKELAAALEKVDPGALLGRLSYSDAIAKQIYLAHTLDDLTDWSYLPELFEKFRRFYVDAAARGNGILLAIT